MIEPDWSIYEEGEAHDPRCPRSNTEGRQLVPCECPKIAAAVRKRDIERARNIR